MKINKIALTILISCYSLVVSSQDFQWLAEQETSFMEVSGNGDIYVVAQLPSNGDVDPGVDEWILDINVISWYLSKYNSSGSFEWAYGFQDATVHSLVANDNQVVLTLSGGEQTVINSRSHNYSSTEKQRYTAVFNNEGDCKQLINLDSRDATIVSAHTDNDGSIFITGTISEEADFDSHITNEQLHESYGDQSGYYAKYTDESYPDWVKVFEDSGAGLLSPKGLVGNDSSNLIWGFYTGNVDMYFTASNSFVYDTLPNMTHFFIANYGHMGALNWSQWYYTSQPSFESIIVDQVTFSNVEDIYITGRYEGNVYDTAANLVMQGGTEWTSAFSLGLEQSEKEIFRYQLSNELETTSPSIVMNPEHNGLWWVGSFSRSMDLDPTAGTFNKTTNINTLSGSAQTHVSAVYFTEFDLDGNLLKINYMNSDPSVLFDKFRTNENRDFYMLAGGSHRNFDHNFGLAEYYDSTLTRSYIALYDGVRIPEALGDEEVVSETSIRFGPNPTQGIIRFSETPDQIRAYDLSGRLLQFPISSNTIDLGNAPAGLCILEVEANGSREVFKVQKL